MEFSIDPNILWVFTGASLLGFTAGLVGCFTYLRRQALIGDVLAHAALPGLTLGFLIWQQRHLAVLLTGAVLSSLLGYLIINLLDRYSRIRRDSGLAIVLSLFFAAGIFQLVMIQKLPVASQAGLDSFLFGKAAALVGKDLQLLVLLALVVLAFTLLFQRTLKYISFDAVFCRTIGVRTWVFELLLSLAVVMTVAIGMQLVGAVLIAAILLTPAASARFWTDRLGSMLLISGCFGALSGFGGALVSISAPKMPTGPWMVVVATVIFGISLLLAPTRGVLYRLLKRLQFMRRIDDENVLRSLYLINSENVDSHKVVESSQILYFRDLSALRLESCLRRLLQAGFIERAGDQIALTKTGFARAQLLTRFHRLWEAYLTRFTEIAADHVHADAEDIEHILDQQLIERLLSELGQEPTDPHGKVIPVGLRSDV